MQTRPVAIYHDVLFMLQLNRFKRYLQQYCSISRLDKSLFRKKYICFFRGWQIIWSNNKGTSRSNIWTGTQSKWWPYRYCGLDIIITHVHPMNSCSDKDKRQIQAHMRLSHVEYYERLHGPLQIASTSRFEHVVIKNLRFITASIVSKWYIISYLFSPTTAA